MTEEKWVPVVGYESFYEVSNLGRVRSKDRTIVNNIATFTQQGRILKTSTTRNGYHKYVLTCENKKQKTLLAHRVVAQAWISNPLNKKNVNHINGIKTDNRVSNLEWSTDSENVRHALSTGLINVRKGEQVYFSKFTNAQALYIKTAFTVGDLSIRELSDMFELPYRTVADIARNRTWKHIKVLDEDKL